LEEYLQAFKGCVIVVSHDRYFMDKVVDHLMVFKGDAELKDFPGNYTDYREWNDLLEEQEKDEKKKNKEPKSKNKEQGTKTQDNLNKTQQAKMKEPESRKLSFKEKKEFEGLEKEIPALEKENTEIETQLASGNLSTEEILKVSQQHALINGRIDEKTLRWLELSEI